MASVAIGHIDAIQAGFVHGWAHDKSSTASENYVALKVDGRLYSKAPTNIYRQDLVDAEVTDGLSGFLLPVDEVLKDNLGKKVELVINEKPVTINDFLLAEPDGKFWVGVDNIENGHVLGSLVSERFEGVTALSVYSQGSEVARVELEVTPGRNTFVLPLPVSMFDDDYHLLTIGVDNYPFALWQDTKKLTGIMTPWEYLQGSYKEPGFIGLSPSSRRRYESLRLQSEAVVTGSLPGVEFSDLVTAHDVVVKGWQNRKEFPKLVLPKYQHPDVSIIIPAYNKIELTYHCIASIILAKNYASYEVLVADDCSTDETASISEFIENVVHIKNPENLRFLRSCNNAAQYASGKYLIFLNNDTEVSTGWIDELLEPFKGCNVGLTGSKLLNLDGSLQEAGGIIWGSGQPWNVGNGANPLAPEFNYTRDADYVSGASMCISTDAWKKVEGFSEELAPCYYEDTDIAFKVREIGLRTVYCPMSEVVHFEGQSHGKDVTKGLKRYQVVNETKFKSKWFKQYKDNGEEGLDLLIQKDRNIDHRVLVIDYATPDKNADAGSYAAVQEIKLLQKLGMKVTFVPENMAVMGKLTKYLQRMGVEVLYAPFYSSVFDVIEKRINEFNAIYITRYSVAEKYIESIRARTNAKIVFNNADLHFLRELRAAETTGEYSIEQAVETRSKELDVMNKVDAILSYNETEHAVIQSHNLKGDNIFRCPWVLTEKDVGPDFKSRSDIAFLGGFRHHPNVEAVKYFVKDVMPLIREKNSNIKFHIYGSHPSEEVKELACDDVIVHGFVENLDDVFYQHRLIVAPLLSGAGIKGKVLEAMSYGTPQVLTKVASEATGLSHKISAWIQDGKEEMAKGVVELYDDTELWRKFSENSRILVNEIYSEAKGLDMMREVFSFVGIYTK